MANDTRNAITSQRGKTVGYIRGGIFYRKFDPARHVLRKPVESLALDESALKQIEEAGAARLVFFTGDGVRFECSLEHFKSASKPLDYGYGKQRALPLTGFVKVRQLGLFEGVTQ